MSLKAGAARVDITPPVGVPQTGFAARDQVSQGVHDPLFAKALVLDDGAAKLALITCDLIGLDKAVVATMRALVERRTGIPGRSVMLACSHTHSGPALADPGYLPDHLVEGIVPAWTDALPHLIAGAVQAADGARVPAKIGFGQGTADIGINRRSRNQDGTTTLGPNPEGPTDSTLSLLRVDRADGAPLAWLINYACHAVVLGPENLLFSADYPGYACDVLENARSDGLIALFVNGTAGNINPRLRGSFESAQALGMALAGEALKVAESIALTSEVTLRSITQEVLLPLKPLPPPETLRKALEAKRAQVQASERDGDLPEDMSGARGELVQLGHQVYVAEELKRLERPEDLDALKKRTEIQGFAIDNTAIIAVPGEVFVEIGLAIRKRSAFEGTAVVGYANDSSVSYVPTKAAFDEGGYEPNWAIVDRDAAAVLEDEASRLLERLHGQALG